MFAFVSGSSSVTSLSGPGGTARWVLLVALLAVSLLYAAARARPLRGVSAAVLPPVVLAWLALVSALWSVNSRLTVERSIAFGLVIATAAALAYASEGKREEIENVLAGILLGAVAVALAGLALLPVSPDDALHQRGQTAVSRFQGIGYSPNTTAMLYALALPVAALAVARARSRLGRVLALSAFVLVDGSLVASGSRGSLVGAFLGCVLLALALGRRGRLALAAACALTVAAAVPLGMAQTEVAASLVPSPALAAAPAQTRPTNPGALQQELRHGTGEDKRTLFGSSGRIDAWRGAIEQASERPVLGYGFGTEERVFFDRYYRFDGDRPSNSWIGLYLQLGLLGALVLLAVLVALAGDAARALRGRCDLTAAACAGAVLAGVPLTVVESWIYSAGNVAALSFWVAALLLVARAAAVAEPAEVAEPGGETKVRRRIGTLARL